MPISETLIDSVFLVAACGFGHQIAEEGASIGQRYAPNAQSDRACVRKNAREHGGGKWSEFLES